MEGYSAEDRILALADFAGTRALLTAVELDLFTELSAGPGSANDLSERTGADPAGLHTLLLALRALGLVRLEGEVFRSTLEADRYLSRRSPHSLAEYLHAEADAWEDWGRLATVVRSARPLHRTTLYREASARAERMVLGDHAIARTVAPALAARLDLRGCNLFLDLGGGAGTYAIAFCRANPGLRCTLLDLPATLRVAERIVLATEVADRIDLVAGDFLVNDLGGPYDVVFASGVLCGQDVDENRTLLARAQRALRPGGRILVRDKFLDPVEPRPPAAAFLPLRLLLLTGRGRPYGEQEVVGWLVEAGFAKARVLEPNTLLEAVRP
jgi:SAM-dependent methyltransferase